jgi:hypothetical protein
LTASRTHFSLSLRRTALHLQQHGQLQGTAPTKVRDADPHFFTLSHVRQVCSVAIISFGEEDRTITEHYAQQKLGGLYETAERHT